MNERRIRCEQRTQAIDVAGVQCGQRGVEAGMRFDSLDLSGLLDAVFSVRPRRGHGPEPWS